MHNKHSYALATLASKVDVPDEIVGIKVIKRTLRATAADLVPIDSLDEQDWRGSIIQSLNQPSSTMATKNLQKCVIVNGELYH